MDYLQEIFSEVECYQDDNIFFKRADLLKRSSKNINFFSERKERIKFLYRDVWIEVFELFKKLNIESKSHFAIENNSIVATSESVDMSVVDSILMKLIPWRKGPWKINDLFIDCEWNSGIKYQDITALNHVIKSKRVADIGGGNGYYSYRAIYDGAEAAVIYDPSEKFFFQFELFQKFLQLEHIQFELGGFIEAVSAAHKYDTVLCMGVLYHQKNPIELVESLRSILVKDGTLILESMIYDAPGCFFFLPEGRYAKARNVYFLPTIEGMYSLLKRIGFGNIEVVSTRLTSIEEQRKTKYMPFESLESFLSTEDENETVEGYQRPIRATIKATLL